jgi:hypothetical protein
MQSTPVADCRFPEPTQVGDKKTETPNPLNTLKLAKIVQNNPFVLVVWGDYFVGGADL